MLDSGSKFGEARSPYRTLLAKLTPSLSEKRCILKSKLGHCIQSYQQNNRARHQSLAYLKHIALDPINLIFEAITPLAVKSTSMTKLWYH